MIKKKIGGIIKVWPKVFKKILNEFNIPIPRLVNKLGLKIKIYNLTQKTIILIEIFLRVFKKKNFFCFDELI